MKIMVCPLNGPRNIEEFHCRGEVRAMPDPSTASDEQWAEYLFMEANPAGMVREWWLHVPSSTWFIAERDTVTGEIHATYLPEHLNSKRAKR
jgi:sarcosine oxidase, subunit delta